MNTVDDALSYTVDLLRAGQPDVGGGGYDIRTSDLADRYVVDREGVAPNRPMDPARAKRKEELSPLFYAALWELSRRGILRPGLRHLGESGTGHNRVGEGYCVTPQGRLWLSNAEYESIATVIPGRFVHLLGQHEKRFGAGYLSRGGEAVRCFGAHAFLACCAMCGAAAESILLALACERMTEEKALTIYGSTGGRGRIEIEVLNGTTAGVQRHFKSFTYLLNYWRDEAAHGQASTLGETEAFTSLMLLLRFARFADETFEA